MDKTNPITSLLQDNSIHKLVVTILQPALTNNMHVSDMVPYLARENVAKRRERIIQRFVVNALVQVLDENVADARLADRRIPLRPHDTTRSTFDRVKVHGVQSTFS